MENKPTHNVYIVHDRSENQKSIWMKVGVGYEHSDEEGINVLLHSVPLKGRIVLRKAADAPKA